MSKALLKLALDRSVRELTADLQVLKTISLLGNLDSTSLTT
jgi:hypothetical protein